MRECVGESFSAVNAGPVELGGLEAPGGVNICELRDPSSYMGILEGGVKVDDSESLYEGEALESSGTLDGDGDVWVSVRFVADASVRFVADLSVRFVVDVSVTSLVVVSVGSFAVVLIRTVSGGTVSTVVTVLGA